MFIFTHNKARKISSIISVNKFNFQFKHSVTNSPGLQNKNISCPISQANTLWRNSLCYKSISYEMPNQFQFWKQNLHKNWFKSDVKAKIEIQFETSEIRQSICLFSFNNGHKFDEFVRDFSAASALSFDILVDASAYTGTIHAAVLRHESVLRESEWMTEWGNETWDEKIFHLGSLSHSLCYSMLFFAVYIMSGSRSMRSLFF